MKFLLLIIYIYSGSFSGIYISNSTEACLHVLKTSNANIVIVDDANQLQKIIEVKPHLPELKAIVKISKNSRPSESVSCFQWCDLLNIDTTDVEIEYERRLSEITANECCAILYTSGTTGLPKAAMISHDNFTWTACNAARRLGMTHKSREVLVSYLPLSHMAGQMMDVFLSLATGATVHFADKDAMKTSFMETLVEVRPTFFVGVPRIYEKLQSKIMEIESQSGVLVKRLDSLAKNLCLKYHTSGSGNQPVSLKFLTEFILNRKKASLGLDQCRNLISGAAPMSREMKSFFLSLDLQIRELYGMTEVTIHCVSEKNLDIMGTVGKSLDGTFTKVFNPDKNGRGEICMKGRNVFMGYKDDLESTLKTIDDDGWLHTGDFGYTDWSGYLFVTGRIKEIIITSGGENISPANIENHVKAECSALSNAILIGDKRKYLTMLLTLKTLMTDDGTPRDELATESLNWLDTFGMAHKKVGDVVADVKALQEIQNAIDRANMKAISNAQKVQKFTILPHDFSVPTGELGPSLKLKRSFVVEKYKNVIENLYA